MYYIMPNSTVIFTMHKTGHVCASSLTVLESNLKASIEIPLLLSAVHIINITLADCGGQVGVIRLFNGSSVLDGVVEYCLDSTWTPVCGDDWDESEAAVACRQLGFAGEGIYMM